MYLCSVVRGACAENKMTIDEKNTGCFDGCKKPKIFLNNVQRRPSLQAGAREIASVVGYSFLGKDMIKNLGFIIRGRFYLATRFTNVFVLARTLR